MFNNFLFLSYFWVEIFFIGKLWYFRYFCEMNLYMKLCGRVLKFLYSIIGIFRKLGIMWFNFVKSFINCKSLMFFRLGL